MKIFSKFMLIYIINPLIITFGIYLLLHFTYLDLNDQPQIKQFPATICIKLNEQILIEDLSVIEITNTKNKQIFYKLDPITAERLEKRYPDDDLQKNILKTDHPIFNTLKKQSGKSLVDSFQSVSQRVQVKLNRESKSLKVRSIEKSLYAQSFENIEYCYQNENFEIYFDLKNNSELKDILLNTKENDLTKLVIESYIGTPEIEFNLAGLNIIPKQNKHSFFTEYFFWLKNIHIHLLEFFKYFKLTVLISFCALIIMTLTSFLFAIYAFIEEINSRWDNSSAEYSRDIDHENRSKFIPFYLLISYFFIPAFFLAYLCIPWLPSQSLWTLIIAILIIAFGDGYFSGMYQQILYSLQNEISQKYIIAARAKWMEIRTPGFGLINDIAWFTNSAPSVLRHIIRNIMPSILIIINNRLPFIVGTTIVVEAIFKIHGLFEYLTSAISNKETHLILTLILFCYIFFQTLSLGTEKLIKILNVENSNE